MEESFHVSQRVPADVLRRLCQRSNRRSTQRLAAQLLLLGASATILTAFDPRGAAGWALTAMAFGTFALLTLSMFAIVHEAAHGAMFESRVLNRVALHLAAYPTMYTPAGFREFHWEHHRHTNDPRRDPELSLGGRPVARPTSNPFVYLGYASGLPLLFYKLGTAVVAALPEGVFRVPGRAQAGAMRTPWPWAGLLGYVRPAARRPMRWQARLMLALQAAWWAAAASTKQGVWLVLGAQWAGHALLALYVMCEHNGLREEGSILERTRTIRTNALMRWLLWNMPYHAEHHAYPAVPWHALPLLHEALDGEIRHALPAVAVFHVRVWRDFLHGRRAGEPAP